MASVTEPMPSFSEIPFASPFTKARTRLVGRAASLFTTVRRASLWRTYDSRAAVENACDGEIRQLTAHGARLDPNAVRWDMIGAATSGRRCRI